MKRKRKRLKKKTRVLLVVCASVIVAAALFFGAWQYLAHLLDTQQAAERWEGEGELKASKIRYCIDDVTVKGLRKNDDSIYVMGEHFTDYSRVYVNDRLIEDPVDTPNQIKAIDGTSRVRVDPGEYQVEDTPSLVFENHVNPTGLRTIEIKKILQDEEGNPLTEVYDGTTFSYRLSLSNGNEDTLHLANMVAYNVKSPEGYLCRWDSDNQCFARTSYTSLNDIATEEELAALEILDNWSIEL